MSSKSKIAWLNGDHLSFSEKNAAAYGNIIDNNPMRYQWSERWETPTYIGGPGFSVGKFDTTKDPHDLVAILLQKWNFLGLDDPYNDLELIKDIREKATRTLVFRQLIDNTPIYQSRVVFFFSNKGNFIGYSGSYIPPENLFFVQHITACGQNLGTLDDRGNEIVSCDRFFYFPDDLIEEDIYTIVPVFKLKSANSEGMTSVSILSDLDQSFYRKIDYSYADRRVQEEYYLYWYWYWRDYYLNEECVWPYGCSSNDLDRIQYDLWYYSAILRDWSGRHSWDGNGDDYRARIEGPGEGGYWDGSSAYLSPETRISILSHEFTHGVINTEAPGTETGLAEGLCDVQAMIVNQDTDHWCYHNYDRYDPDPNEPCTNQHHVFSSRCTMLGRDTVGDVPYNNLGTLEPKVPGVLYNIIKNDPHTTGSAYGKVFNLMQVAEWIDPLNGPQDYFNGISISGYVSFYKMHKVFYRFVTQHLAGAGDNPWKTFGPLFIQAVWNSYQNSEITYNEYIKAIKSLYAVGHRQNPLTIPNHLGSKYRQAAIFKDGDIYLFYVAPDSKIYYQKRVSGTWTAPQGFSSGAASSDKGIEGYLLPNGGARIIFKHKNSKAVYYLRILEDGTVPDSVGSFSWTGCPPTTAEAPTGIHDGTYERVFTWIPDGYGTMTMTRIDDCYRSNWSHTHARGLSATRFKDETYIIRTIASGTYDGYNHVWRWNDSSEIPVNTDGSPDYGRITCENYTTGGADWCYDYIQGSYETPNIVGVNMPSGREEFKRIYAGFVTDANEFKLTRFDIDPSSLYMTHRTRILPVSSGDWGNKNEVEFLQTNQYLFVFEGNKMHVIKLY